MFVQKSELKFTDVYDLGKMLDKGAFGEVHECVQITTGNNRAVKILKKDKMDTAEQELMINEVNILKNLDHPNIVQIYEYFEDATYFFIVTELVQGGQLFDEVTRRGKFNERDAATVIKQLLSAVSYCHKNNICHRDIKPENVLLDVDKQFDQIKIVDFGSAKTLTNERMKELHGTCYYVAPEVLTQNYGKECDLWSIGVITYLLLSGTCPFRGATNEDILKAVAKGKYNFQHNAFSKVSMNGQQFISKLLQMNPAKRITAIDALQHPWI